MKSVAASGKESGMILSDYGFSEPSLIWLLSGRVVTAVIGDCPWMIARVCICSPNVVGDAVAAVVSIWGFTTAGTLKPVVPYFISRSRKYLAAYPQPGWVNSSSFIPFCRKLSNRCCTVLDNMPVTQPGSSISLGLPSSVSSPSCFSSSPSCSSSKVERLLRPSLIAFNNSSNYVSGCPVVAPPNFSRRHIVQLLHNRCLCVLNSLSCHSGLAFHIILDPCLFLVVA